MRRARSILMIFGLWSLGELGCGAGDRETGEEVRRHVHVKR